METSKKQFSRDVLDGMAICDRRKKKINEKVPKNNQKQKNNHHQFFEGRIGRNGHLRTMHSQI